MKLTHQRMTSRYNNTPESLTDWLEEQLECRGIDAVVYARYILSLLQEEDSDSDEDNTGANTTTDGNRFRNKSFMGLNYVKEGLKPLKTNKWKHKRYLKQINANNTNGVNVCTDGHHSCGDCWPHSEYCPHSSMNSDEERRLAVVQCLKSASEQEFGIESFVDELCAKLKNIKLLSETNELSLDSKQDIANNNGIKVSVKEQAMKYYAAFPALDPNSNEGITVPKPNTSVGAIKVAKSKDKPKWNGQKIIEFMSGTNPDTNETLNQLVVESASQPTLTLTSTKGCPETDGKQTAKTLDFEFNDKNVENKEMKEKFEKKMIYCRDIESKVLKTCIEGIDTSLVVDCNREENDKFERLVNKFNSNIASIWSTTDTSSAKNDNIWTFDSSFSSNQSSATPSPKPNAIDFWSSMNITEINECLSGKRAPAVDHLLLPEISWESSLLKSINAFPDDGFIDGNDLLEEESIWPNSADKSNVETNTITLQNHQKNSPFVEFHSNPKNTENEPSLQLSKLLAMASLLHKSKHPLSPTADDLLTSPKTHFQPIKHDLLDESDEGSVADITDNEMNKLVICSDKCPNNGDNKSIDNEFALKLRPVSTSFGELASFMGPFNDLDVNPNEFMTSLPISEEMEFNNVVKDSQMSDKSTNTETELQMEGKIKLEPIVETTIESEPEYQDLFHMINEVLRNGISEDDSITNVCSSLSALDDWYDSDFADNNSTDQVPRNREKRLSWNCYWDTYNTTSIEQSFAPKSHFDIDSKPLNEDICGEELSNSYPLSQELSDNNPNDTLDDIFGEELYFSNTSHNNGSVEECREYEEVFDDYYLEDNDFDFETMNGVFCESQSTDFDNSSDISNCLPTFGLPVHLQLKPRYLNVAKRRTERTFRKPCTFFVEGLCKRSDCKYSHEIGSITCKYWEEGFCFKADLCPFLHGYVDDESIINTVSSPLKSKKSYAIESESDFPSLSIHPNSEDNTPIPPIPTELDAKRLEQHFLDFRTKSVADRHSTSGVANAKLPIAVFMKKKVKKRKDRNLQ